jgi:hypothetical protein
MTECSQADNVECQPLRLGGNICQEAAAAAAAAANAAAAAAVSNCQAVKVLLPNLCQATGPAGGRDKQLQTRKTQAEPRQVWFSASTRCTPMSHKSVCHS